VNATAKKTAKKTTAPPVQAKARAAQPARKAVTPAKAGAKATPSPKAAAPKPAVKKTSEKAAPKPTAKAQAVKTASPKVAAKTESAVALKKPAAASKKTSSVAAAPKIEPTPKPLGKRAAKKVMMEQMMQAAVVPTHAPDAAKATFSTMNERVLTPPVPSSIQKDPKRANNWKTLPVEELTDLDVLAMPDSEYMNDVQLAFFRRKLSQLKADMLANAGETTEHLREDTVVVPDPADRATIEEEHALELRTRDRERKLLKKIQQSIGRIDAGDYGYCDETGEAIGVARLMARPTASLSLEAQQRRELKQKMFGD
jgi:DnaK suppressor protein